MSQQSSSSLSTIEPHSTDVHVLTDSISAARKPSWTPSISALSEPAPRRTYNSPSQSEGHSRTHDENATPSLSAGTPPSLPRTRRPSLGPSTLEVSQLARRTLLEAEQSDAVVPKFPDSPEEGKGFRSSWEINVKRLVGDALGNVNLICPCK